MRGQLEYSYDSADQYLQAATQAHSLRPQDNFVRQMLADALWTVGSRQDENGYPRDAYESYREAFVNDPTRADAVASAVYAALEMGDLDLAQQTASLASPAQRDVFQVLVYSGMTALRRSDYQTARQCFEKATKGDGAEPVEWRPETPTMHIGLGVVLLKSGQGRAAHEHFRRAIEISTRGLDTLYNIVDLCSTHGFTSDARIYAQELADLASSIIAVDAGRSVWYEYRALAYSVLGDEERANRDTAAARSLSNWYSSSPSPDSPLTQSVH